MAKAMPRALIFAAVAAGVAAAHQSVVLTIAVAGGARFWWIPAIYVVWGGVVLFAIWFRSRWAWKVGSLFASIIGGISVACLAIAVISCLVAALKGRPDVASGWLPDVHRFFFCAAYLLTTYYLLQRPTSLVYFREEDSG
jgi:hypothetical protein